MVSSTCTVSCHTMSRFPANRKLSIDPRKDYSSPLQVETSVEYDLPAHIYPPKGSKPILMIHPSYTLSKKQRKLTVSTPTSVIQRNVSTGRPLSGLQIYNNPTQLSRSDSKLYSNGTGCICGNPSCASTPMNITRSRRVDSAQRSVSYVQNIQNTILEQSSSPYSTSMVSKLFQNQQLLQQKADLQKRIQQQNQINYNDRIIHTSQASLLKEQEPISKPAPEQLLTWVGKCQGPCCQPLLGALAPTQAEFLAPGLPPSLLARTPTRGSSGGSPKLRARSRRGISVANTVNLPEYLGSTRPSRSIPSGNVIPSHTSHIHQRSRSSASSLLNATTPAPITTHQVSSALDVVRALTPKSLFTQQTKSGFHQSTTNSFLSTVGQSIDSGCSMGGDMFSGSAVSTSMPVHYSSGKNIDRCCNIVDSGFCTPVDNAEDLYMEPLDMNMSGSTPTSVRNVAFNTSLKESGAWLNDLTMTQLTPSAAAPAIHNTFLPQTNIHYLHQQTPIWNLVY